MSLESAKQEALARLRQLERLLDEVEDDKPVDADSDIYPDSHLQLRGGLDGLSMTETRSGGFSNDPRELRKLSPRFSHGHTRTGRDVQRGK